MGLGRSAIPGCLADYLDVLNLEANDWIDITALTNMILGPSRDEYDLRPSSLYLKVLRPLIWSGLLLETGHGSSDNSIMKSPLWHAALELPSDRQAGNKT